MTYITRVAGPFLVGLVVGTGLIATGRYWAPDTESVVRLLAIAAGLLLTLVVVIWLVYRRIAASLPVPEKEALKATSARVFKDPKLLFDSAFWSKDLAPQLPAAAPMIAAWASFSASLAVVTLVLTNILLLATLLVQMLSADRLAAQNDLLTEQNKFLQIQARVDANRMVQEEIARMQVYDRRWGELHAFRLDHYGRTTNGVFEVTGLQTLCERGQDICEEDVRISQINRPANALRALFVKQHDVLRAGIDDAAISDPVVHGRSTISEILNVMRIASNACYGKEEFTLQVVGDLEALLVLEQAAAEYENTRADTRAAVLEVAYVAFQRRFFGPFLEKHTWNQFPDAFAVVIERLHADVLSVLSYCEEAVRNSEAVVDELRTFLDATAPKAE